MPARHPAPSPTPVGPVESTGTPVEPVETTASRRALAILPGVLLAGVVAVAALLAAGASSALTAATLAVAGGAVLANLADLLASRRGPGTPRQGPAKHWTRWLQPGATFAGTHLLRVAVVLLGLQLSLVELAALGAPGLLVIAATVTVTFLGTRALARLLGLPRNLGLLIATGFAICGASAVAAMAQATDADEDDQAIAVALVTLCGTCAIVALPLLNLLLGMPPDTFGSWVGASVQDVGQTAAAAQQVPGALPAAMVVKLSRVVLLAPLVAAVAVAIRVQVRRSRSGAGPTPAGRPPLVPWFVVGFALMVVAGTVGHLPEVVLTVAHQAQELFLTAALFGLGTGIRIAAIRRAGLRPVVVGLLSWLLVAGVGLLAVVLVLA